MSLIIDSLAKLAEKFSQKYPGEASGVATLDGSSKVVEDPGSAAYTKGGASGILGLDASSRIPSTQIFSTEGTEIYRASGVSDFDNIASNITGTGVVKAFTIPADLLNEDGDSLRALIFGEKIGTTFTKTLDIRFGTTPTSVVSMALGTPAGYWSYEIVLIRRLSTSVFVNVRGILDQIGGTTGIGIMKSVVISSDIDLTSDQTLDIYVSASGGTDTVQEVGAIIEFLP